MTANRHREPITAAAEAAPGQRPRLKLPWSGPDVLLEALAALGLAALVVLAVVYWSRLPQRIPVHFDFRGQPDRWSGKAMFALLPAIGAVIYAGLTVLSRFPHSYNYLWPITPQNAERQYLIARRMVIILKTLVVWLFAGIVWGTVQVALQLHPTLSPWLVYVPLALVFLSIWACLFAGWRAR